MGDVVGLRPELVGDGAHIDPDKILEAHKGALKTVVVIGLSKTGDFVIAGSEGRAETCFAMQKALSALTSFGD